MKFNILHILVILFISGVKSQDGEDTGVIINDKNATGVPAASTVPPSTISPPTTTKNDSTPTTSKPTTTITPSTPTQKTSTSTTPVTPITTVTTPTVPTTTQNSSSTPQITTAIPTEGPAAKGRHFDGPSFVGGMILTTGLMAICFVAWKFYKARTELHLADVQLL